MLSEGDLSVKGRIAARRPLLRGQDGDLIAVGEAFSLDLLLWPTVDCNEGLADWRGGGVGQQSVDTRQYDD